MAGEAGLSLCQDRGPLEFSAHVEKPQRIKCVVFSLALGHSRDSSKKKIAVWLEPRIWKLLD